MVSPKVASTDAIDSLKVRFKRYSKLYLFLTRLFSPVFSDPKLRIESFFSRKVADSMIVLNLGSGNQRHDSRVINVDLLGYENVDIVSDISSLPFADNSVDIVASSAVLEHVPDPYQVVTEAHRVLKKDGLIYSYIPFMQGYHASPHDYTRFTKNGIMQLHKEFKILEVKPAAGPTSALCWILAEWLALICSLGSSRLFVPLSVAWMVILSPLKFLDTLLIYHPKSENIASGFTVIARKQ